MPERSRLLAVDGWAVHAPGWAGTDLPGSPAEPACPPERAKEVLGRKGLLGKEPATRLALCAVHRALGLPPGRPTEPLPGAAGTAVVVASNFGNVETVCTVLTDMRERSGSVVSPMDAPNASSNVIASTIAIWYGFTGPNLTVCSGATAGLDAIRLARLLLLSGRADKAVVVGVEPADPVAARLAALRPEPGETLAAAAGCVLLGVPGAWPEPSGLLCGPVGRHSDPVPVAGPEPGEMYGAAGIVRLAVAASRLAGSGPDTAPVTVGCGDTEDGWASLELVRHAHAGAAV
ncbi:beta-ketoacyl synthase N-terminal-like domain-containing protein [Streptomyces sp. H10-C2]|uniref:beta-ketoacyl synthase N-terminal-like domain-containing protein n=1 Tax=unclassified Streptomyces TaxID=2593676 RepID=UPI0024BB1CDD|nr:MULTISPECIES: beta-ketoacyl synthase N-terminal-like domain-containing protein [unclassified Streptomyces]MDJ0346536.1 beta-ketoacyl synthase N-terminal-like domain-containing protein [Streptomyces sp. PH10-H1]MDJ0374341.1 beta-ketoacyl synthase N-terminal-like domain-containing protein [Streptomyces sp. H10-C2]